MNRILFEWDTNKAKANIIKHGVSFEEAATVFDDECAILFDDPDHSILEERFLIIGLSVNARVLTVCHCVRFNERMIRIISARKATKNEIAQYREINRGWQ